MYRSRTSSGKTGFRGKIWAVTRYVNAIAYRYKISQMIYTLQNILGIWTEVHSELKTNLAMKPRRSA